MKAGRFKGTEGGGRRGKERGGYGEGEGELCCKKDFYENFVIYARNIEEFFLPFFKKK